MSNDKVMKWLCLLIATGVWANVFVSSLRPEPVYANKTAEQSLEVRVLTNINDVLMDISLELIRNGSILERRFSELNSNVTDQASALGFDLRAISTGTCFNTKLCN